jgi:GTP-binding protein
LPPFVLHLVDFRHGFLERDLELSEWLSVMRVGELPVFTKIDKISRGARKATLEKYLKNLSIPEQNCILTSSEDNSGIEELRTLIENYGRSA